MLNGFDFLAQLQAGSWRTGLWWCCKQDKVEVKIRQ